MDFDLMLQMIQQENDIKEKLIIHPHMPRESRELYEISLDVLMSERKNLLKMGIKQFSD